MPKRDVPMAEIKPPALFIHIKRRLADYTIRTIMDVGANCGQSCIPFSIGAPEARIYSFEPVPATYKELCRNIAGYSKIAAFNVALGAEVGQAPMLTKGTSAGNRIEIGASGDDYTVVPVTTGDVFVAQNGIDHVSFLKIDAEGHDLAVLQGFSGTLSQVDFIQVEAGMNPYNTLHVPYRDFEDFLRGHGFQLFHIYGQTFEFGGNHPILRRSNPVFINPRLINMTGP